MSTPIEHISDTAPQAGGTSTNLAKREAPQGTVHVDPHKPSKIEPSPDYVPPADNSGHSTGDPTRGASNAPATSTNLAKREFAGLVDSNHFTRFEIADVHPATNVTPTSGAQAGDKSVVITR